MGSKGCCGRAQDNAAITPVISKSSADFIEGLVKDAEAKGATLKQPYHREGNLIWPVLVDHVTPVRAPHYLWIPGNQGISRGGTCNSLKLLAAAGWALRMHQATHACVTGRCKMPFTWPRWHACMFA